MMIGRCGLVVLMAVMLGAGGATGQTGDSDARLSGTPERLEIGHFGARALLQCSESATGDAPVAIVIPGSGAHGPEEAMPGMVTRDGKDTELLTSFAQGLRAAGFHTLQLGKPGIEFHTTWQLEDIAYDKDLFLALTWSALVENANEAVAFVSSEHPCGASTVVLVGHSEGTMRISDVASENPAVRGLVFLGFHGRGFRDMVDWQAYERPVELFVRPDVDTDRDGFVTRDEASKWPNDFSYPWKDGETRISIAVYAQYLRSVPETRESIEALASMPLYSNGFWGRPPTYQKVAALSIPILAFTGSLDVMTPPSELEALESACKDVGKVDCETHLIQGVGHGFSAPRPPRGHALLDKTEGPVDPRFLELFTQALSAWRPGVRPKQSPM